jgi:hypothetical protein
MDHRSKGFIGLNSLTVREIRKIIDRYFNNRASAREMELIDAWYHAIKAGYSSTDRHVSLEQKIWNRVATNLKS